MTHPRRAKGGFVQAHRAPHCCRHMSTPTRREQWALRKLQGEQDPITVAFNQRTWLALHHGGVCPHAGAR